MRLIPTIIALWITALTPLFVAAAEPQERSLAADTETSPTIEQNNVPGEIPGQWNLSELKKTPGRRWLSQSGAVHSLLYDSEKFQGRETEVFAFYASPTLHRRHGIAVKPRLEDPPRRDQQ